MLAVGLHPYRSIIHEFKAGAKISQTNVSIHIQENVVWLDVSAREREQHSILCERCSKNPEQNQSKLNRQVVNEFSCFKILALAAGLENTQYTLSFPL